MAITVVRAGMLTTVQDLGRWGHQHLGVPVAGPMDWYAHRLANRLVGNPDDAAALEVTLIGPELATDAHVVCATAGAEFELTAGGRSIVPGEAFELRAGERLRFGPCRAGCRATLAVAGGLAVPPVLGSRATSLISRLGPFGGRALQAGDSLPVGTGPRRPPATGAVRLAPPAGGARLRVVPGPHEDRFAAGTVEDLPARRYVVTPESNRMGYRLEGPPIVHSGSADMLSDATPVGSIQVPASGLPILLMADRQTTGGYPRIATVITADLPVAGQLAPGDWIEFVPCTRRQAVEALRERVAALQGLRP
ncbi:MAG TPA: biotin-dependent carboxyltransferase family protein [Vicinamibacterales bacterium]|nr:biotin-dependent carboxyltransferase family protein [Vicinamibacterales bacterium]